MTTIPTILQKRRKWNERKKNGFYLWIESFHLELLFGFFFCMSNEAKRNRRKTKRPGRTHVKMNNGPWILFSSSRCHYYYYRSERIKLLQCCNFNFSSFIRRNGFFFVGSFKSPSVKLRKKLRFFLNDSNWIRNECKGIHEPTLMIHKFCDWSENLRIWVFLVRQVHSAHQCTIIVMDITLSLSYHWLDLAGAKFHSYLCVTCESQHVMY